MVSQFGFATWFRNLVPQLGPPTLASTQAGQVEAEDEPQPTRLGMLRLKLRPIDGATRKLEVALEFSYT